MQMICSNFQESIQPGAGGAPFPPGAGGAPLPPGAAGMPLPPGAGGTPLLEETILTAGEAPEEGGGGGAPFLPPFAGELISRRPIAELGDVFADAMLNTKHF